MSRSDRGLFPGMYHRVRVTSPAGTTVTLTTDNGGTNSNTFDGTFWDDGVGFLNPPGPVSDNPLIGTQLILVPEEAMGAFIGEDPNGTWTITVTDDTAQNTGTLLDWALDLTTLPAPPIFAASASKMSMKVLPISFLFASGSSSPARPPRNCSDASTWTSGML